MMNSNLRKNVPLLRKTLEHIEENPKDWNQGVWGSQWEPLMGQRKHSTTPCNTACCFAGNAIILSGGNLTLSGRVVGLPEVEGLDIPVAAEQLLGLNKREALELFDGGNSLKDVRRIVGELIGQAEDEDMSV